MPIIFAFHVFHHWLSNYETQQPVLSPIIFGILFSLTCMASLLITKGCNIKVLLSTSKQPSQLLLYISICDRFLGLLWPVEIIHTVWRVQFETKSCWPIFCCNANVFSISKMHTCVNLGGLAIRNNCWKACKPCTMP